MKETDSAAATANGFTERLRVPWWYWPLPLIAAGLLAAEVHMGYPGVRSWLPYVVLIPLTLWALVWLGRSQVGVVGDELVVAKNRLPLRHVGRVEVLDATAKRVALGRELDPAAFVWHRGWVPSVLRVEVLDPDSTAPYWVFSARSAERLAGLLRSTR